GSGVIGDALVDSSAPSRVKHPSRRWQARARSRPRRPGQAGPPRPLRAPCASARPDHAAPLMGGDPAEAGGSCQNVMRHTKPAEVVAGAGFMNWAGMIRWRIAGLLLAVVVIVGLPYLVVTLNARDTRHANAW